MKKKNIFLIIIEIFLFPCSFGYNYRKKYNNYKKSGYILTLPLDHSYNKYGYIKTHGKFDVGVYYKYGNIWVLNENNKFEYLSYYDFV